MPERGHGHGGPHRSGGKGRINPGIQQGRNVDRERARRSQRSDGRRASDDSDRVSVHLEDDIVRELKATARPGKHEILVKTFAEAATAFAEDDLETAIKLADQAKHMALRAPSVRELLGISHYHQGNFKEASKELSAFRRITGSTEQNPVIADCYRAMDRPERAVELIDEMDHRVLPASVFYEGQIVAAGALADMKDLDGAIARLQKLNLKPGSPQEHHLRAWYVLGDLLERKGRFTQARELFEAAVALDPEATDAGERAEKLRKRQ